MKLPECPLGERLIYPGCGSKEKSPDIMVGVAPQLFKYMNNLKYA
jgi:hypothetical protein